MHEYSNERMRLAQYGLVIKTLVDAIKRHPADSLLARQTLDAIYAEKVRLRGANDTVRDS